MIFIDIALSICLALTIVFLYKVFFDEYPKDDVKPYQQGNSDLFGQPMLFSPSAYSPPCKTKNDDSYHYSPCDVSTPSVASPSVDCSPSSCSF